MVYGSHGKIYKNGKLGGVDKLIKDADDLPFLTSPIKDIPYRPIKMAGLGTAVWFMRLMDYLETR